MSDQSETRIDASALAVVRTPRCMVCGEGGQAVVDRVAYQAWRDGAYIQEAFPTQTASYREQLLTGIHPKCWESLWEDQPVCCDVCPTEHEQESDTYCAGCGNCVEHCANTKDCESYREPKVEIKTLTRWGYKNSTSSRGKQEKHVIDISRIAHVRKWINQWGNPSYNLITDSGDWYYTVDDYGGSNDVGCTITLCDIKRDLFAGCVAPTQEA